MKKGKKIKVDLLDIFKLGDCIEIDKIMLFKKAHFKSANLLNINFEKQRVTFIVFK